MILRLVKGTVASGREADFIAVCRQQVADGARAPGLIAFFCGYRRVDGTERFVIASTWQTEDDAIRTAGEDDRLRANDLLSGIARIESVERFRLVEPVYRGIVDAPGGVIRITSAVMRPDRRQQMFAWLTARDRNATAQRLLLGWAIGEDMTEASDRITAVTAWPSPLVIEALAEPGRAGTSMFAATDEFVTDTRVEQYQAIALDLPDELADIGSRRVIAARFPVREPADATAVALVSGIDSARETQISVAPLGAPGTAADVRTYILVARVAMGDYARAERLIADNGGEVILTSREPARAGPDLGPDGPQHSGAPTPAP